MIPDHPECRICGARAVDGDPLLLCQRDGGIGWSDFDDRAFLGLAVAS